MNKATQSKPSNGTLTSRVPLNGSLNNPKPLNSNLTFPTFVYTEIRTITTGTPYIWGLNWCITYPSTLNFTGVRI